MEIETIDPRSTELETLASGYLREIKMTDLFSQVKIYSKRIYNEERGSASHAFVVEFYRGPLALKIESASVNTSFPDTYVENLYEYICEDANRLYKECIGKPVDYHFYLHTRGSYFGFKIVQQDNW